MRTVSLFGLSFAVMLILAMLAASQVAMWVVFGIHVICLIILATNDDALTFSQENTSVAMMIEVTMFATALATIVAFMNEYLVASVFTAGAYTGCWYSLLRFSPQFPNRDDESLFAVLADDGKSDDQ
jgi:hypothetical protein